MSVLGLGILTVIPVMLLPFYRCTVCREVVAPGARVCRHGGTPIVGAAIDLAVQAPITAEDAGPALTSIGMLAMVGLIATAATEVGGIAVLSGAGEIGFCIAAGVVLLSLVGIGATPSFQAYRQARRL